MLAGVAPSEIEFEPTRDPVAVLRDAAGRAPALDQEIATAAERVATEQSGGAEHEPAA